MSLLVTSTQLLKNVNSQICIPLQSLCSITHGSHSIQAYKYRMCLMQIVLCIRGTSLFLIRLPGAPFRCFISLPVYLSHSYISLYQPFFCNALLRYIKLYNFLFLSALKIVSPSSSLPLFVLLP